VRGSGERQLKGAANESQKTSMSDAKRILFLGLEWPDQNRNNIFWIGAARANVYYEGKPIVLGHTCKNIEELEIVATQMKTDIDLALAQARAKFG
jgi:hypothetical protein